MPSLDGGHYFLTVVAPIRSGVLVDPVTGAWRSHRQMLAQSLALLPPGQQTARSLPGAPPSPFARAARTHLARFVIINDPPYNGRVTGDSLLGMIRGTDPTVAQPVDTFKTPYLLFAADVDAKASADPAGDYAAELWRTMRAELIDVFSHCVGFEARCAAFARRAGEPGVAEADRADLERKAEAGFVDYLKRCEIETTMPFNDYWPDGLSVAAPPLPLTPLKIAAVAAVSALGLWIVCLLLGAALHLFGARGALRDGFDRASGWGVLVVPLAFGAAALAAYAAYRTVMRRGQAPFPACPVADLPTVLKALHLQQAFTRFAISVQGCDDARLHAEFGRFLGLHQPAAPQPTQPPGVLRAALQTQAAP